jgi:hypothetical protein
LGVFGSMGRAALPFVRALVAAAGAFAAGVLRVLWAGGCFLTGDLAGVFTALALPDEVARTGRFAARLAPKAALLRGRPEDGFEARVRC